MRKHLTIRASIQGGKALLDRPKNVRRVIDLCCFLTFIFPILCLLSRWQALSFSYFFPPFSVFFIHHIFHFRSKD